MGNSRRQQMYLPSWDGASTIELTPQPPHMCCSFSWVRHQLSKEAPIDEGRWSFLVTSSDMDVSYMIIHLYSMHSMCFISLYASLHLL
jgi:hypothetical protein